MGVFRNENAAAHPFRDAQQQGKCSKEQRIKIPAPYRVERGFLFKPGLQKSGVEGNFGGSEKARDGAVLFGAVCDLVELRGIETGDAGLDSKQDLVDCGGAVDHVEGDLGRGIDGGRRSVVLGQLR